VCLTPKRVNRVWQAIVRGFFVRLPKLHARRARVRADVEEEVSASRLREELERLRATTEAKLKREMAEKDGDMPDWKRELKRREAAKEVKRRKDAMRFAAVVRIQVRDSDSDSCSDSCSAIALLKCPAVLVVSTSALRCRAASAVSALRDVT
jgi:hypothetical protein